MNIENLKAAREVILNTPESEISHWEWHTCFAGHIAKSPRANGLELQNGRVRYLVVDYMRPFTGIFWAEGYPALARWLGVSSEIAEWLFASWNYKEFALINIANKAKFLDRVDTLLLVAQAIQAEHQG